MENVAADENTISGQMGRTYGSRSNMEHETTVDNAKSLKTLTAVIYGLYAASFLFGITAIVAIIINYVKKQDVAGTFLESHFRWQIRTFWFGLLWSVLGIVTMLIAIGWFIMVLTGIWFIYRVVKGWLYLNDGKSIYAA